MGKILFRGKRKDNAEWEYGFYCLIGHTGKEKPYIIPIYASAFYGIAVDIKTLGRYTGQKDKNGVMIFEGDIITGSLEKIAYVKWVQEHCAYLAYCKSDNKYYWLECGNEQFENIRVIGNIHDKGVDE